MGSPLRLTLVGVGDAQALAAWSAVSATIEQIEESLSRHRPTSELTALNRRAGEAELHLVGRRLAAALAAADRAHRLTGGAFDPRVLADMERFGWTGAPLAGAGIARSEAAGRPDPAGDQPGARPQRTSWRSPDNAAPPGRAAAFADGRWLRRDPRRRAVSIAGPVDLDGIGKGLGLRWAFDALRAALPALGTSAGALLEAGGDLVLDGQAPQPGPWMIGIEDPRGRPDELAVLALERGAVCTSSVRVHTREGPDGRPVHHLLDPRTGEPGGPGLLAVTVAGPDPAWAEVWSKALFLQGARDIGPAARRRDLAAWWVTSEGSLEMTPAARQLTAWDG